MSVSELTETETTFLDQWADGDLRAMQYSGHYRVTEYLPEFRAWMVLNPVFGFEHANENTCSCLGHGDHGGEVCEHMRAVRAYLSAMEPPNAEWLETITNDWGA